MFLSITQAAALAGVVVSTPLAQEIALKMNRSAGQVLNCT